MGRLSKTSPTKATRGKPVADIHIKWWFSVLERGEKAASLTSSRVSSPPSPTTALLIKIMMMTVMIQFFDGIHHVALR